jgi:4'-phosphopantetheinyl transferase
MAQRFDEEIYVWYTALNAGDRVTGALRHLLSADEAARAERFHFERDRRRFVIARATLRLLLSRYTGQPPEQITFTYSRRGKPFLAENLTGLEFNLAHSHELALYGFTAGTQIGVDVEYTGRDVAVDEIAEHFFSQEEVSAFRSLPPAQRVAGFFNCWTRKEAFLKANGEGIAHGLDQFTVSLAPGAPAELRAEQGWSLYHLEPAAGYVGAVAMRAPLRRLRLLEWQNG